MDGQSEKPETPRKMLRISFMRSEIGEAFLSRESSVSLSPHGS